MNRTKRDVTRGDQLAGRPKPSRTTPERNAGTMYRAAEKVSDRPPVRKRTTEDTVVRTVRVASRIADEQIKRGQEWARRLRTNSGAPKPDIGSFLDGSFRLSKELAVLLVELAESIVQTPGTLSAVREYARSAQAAAAPGTSVEAVATNAAPTQAPVPLSCPLEVDADRPLRLHVELTRPLGDFAASALTAFPLYGMDDAIVRVTVRADGAGKAESLMLQVKGKKPGTYTGLVKARDLREPVAYVTVTVLDAWSSEVAS